MLTAALSTKNSIHSIISVLLLGMLANLSAYWIVEWIGELHRRESMQILEVVSLMRDGHNQQALEACRRLTVDFPNSFEALELRAILNKKLHNVEDARKDNHLIVSKFAFSYLDFDTQANAYMELGDLQKALAAANTSVAMGNPGAEQTRAEVCRRLDGAAHDRMFEPNVMRINEKD